MEPLYLGQASSMWMEAIHSQQIPVMNSYEGLWNTAFMSVMGILIMVSQSSPLWSPRKARNGMKHWLYKHYGCIHNGEFHNGMVHNGPCSLPQFSVMKSSKGVWNTGIMSVMSILIMVRGNVPLWTPQKPQVAWSTGNMSVSHCQFHNGMVHNGISPLWTVHNGSIMNSSKGPKTCSKQG